jgi:hypothetical protein
MPAAAWLRSADEVDAQTGKKLTAAQAGSLLDRVQGIEAALNC